MRRIVELLCLAVWLALPATPAAGQVVTVLHSFDGPNDGRNPAGSLLQSGSTFFGMTSGGGPNFGNGTIFKMAMDGTSFLTMHTFASGLNDGDTPNGSLIQSGSTLFGMTQFGGSAGSYGTIFKIGVDSTGFGIVHRFAGGPTDGSSPFGSLVQSGTSLYGFTSSGGSFQNSNGLYNNGAIFKIGTDGTGYSILHSYAGFPTDGSSPRYGALAVSGTTLYGTTLVGGSANAGTIYRINTDGTGYTILHSFAASVGGDGAAPQGQLFLAGSTLYGMTQSGGGANLGTIYRIGTDGSGFGIWHSFVGGPGDGSHPDGEFTSVGLTLYATTGDGGSNALGTILGIGADGNGYSVVRSFTGGPGDGAGPSGDLTLSGSNSYGMTSQGGIFNNGTIFSFAPIPEPSSVLLVGTAGAAAILAHYGRRRKKLAS